MKLKVKLILKKILIFYGTYGGGHIAAAKSIKNFIDSHYEDTDIEFIDCIEYISKYANKISTKAYVELTKNTPRLWKKLYSGSNKGAIATISNASNRIMAVKLKHLIKEKRPDLIISTHPFSSHMCAILKKKKQIDCELATIMTDYHIHNQWLSLPEFVDYFFVANEQMKLDMIKKEIPAEKIFVTGIPVSPRFQEQFDKDEIFDEFWLDKDKFTVLLFGGGEFGLGKNVAVKVLESTVRMFRDIQVVAISGKNKKMHAAFEEIVEKTNSSARVKVLEFTDKVPELMAISGIVVTKAGGLTITESLVSGLPIVIINPIPGQEEENAQFLVNSGCAIWIKQKEKNIPGIFKELYRNKELLGKMKEASIKLSKPNSTRDICDILLKRKDEPEED